jgi:hypothetical protein
MRGSWLLPRDMGCVWCESQVQPCPLTRMVSIAVATPCGDSCGMVRGGGRSELQGSPQSYHEYEWHVFELYGTLAKYLSQRF